MATVHAYDAIIVGTGAAGFNAALRLHQLGVTNIAVITEGITVGTSRNTGSDKQTYYKLSLAGAAQDSPALMARDLFDGGCVDGDIALSEAAGSARAFLSLCELGVAFPTNRYGAYVGYRTDHDTRARATSAGPLTSRYMTEALEAAVRTRSIPVWDGYLVLEILTDDNGAAGLLAMDDEAQLHCFAAPNIVYATGGPAGIYEDSVYPGCHHGGSGVAFAAGIPGRNLTEWQYGLASLRPRWNVSGTYMQVLPRFFSLDADGNEHEFLRDAYADEGACLSAVFRKGYEWPFDVRRAMDGSSKIDMLVWQEKAVHGRRVFLDYRRNPFGLDALPYDMMAREAQDYLARAGAQFGLPIDRLLHMNAPAYDLYLSKGVDLRKEPLEIALSAQHHNGGLDIDTWWQTPVSGIYAAGEVAGSHGVSRPGGSALNAGQVGSLRAAQHIARHGRRTAAGFQAALEAALVGHEARRRALLQGPSNVQAIRTAFTREMSRVAGPIRDPDGIRTLLSRVKAQLTTFDETVRAGSPHGLWDAFRLLDMLRTQQVVLTAMDDYTRKGGTSRGSGLYRQGDGFALGEDTLRGHIQTADLLGGCHWRPVHPIPQDDDFFENIWRGYRENGNVV